MLEKKNKAPMYDGAVSYNLQCGCKFDCVYCAFKEIAKLQGCHQCRAYEPHWHPERVLTKEEGGSRYLKEKMREYTKKVKECGADEAFFFLPDLGDICFIEPENLKTLLTFVEKYSDKIFLFQSKNPAFFLNKVFPPNVVFGTTLETNRLYKGISKAPAPERRKDAMVALNGKKWVTIEPIMDFDHEIFLSWLRQIKPEKIYIGFESAGLLRAEFQPSKEKFEAFVSAIKKEFPLVIKKDTPLNGSK